MSPLLSCLVTMMFGVGCLALFVFGGLGLAIPELPITFPESLAMILGAVLMGFFWVAYVIPSIRWLRDYEKYVVLAPQLAREYLKFIEDARNIEDQARRANAKVKALTAKHGKNDPLVIEAGRVATELVEAAKIANRKVPWGNISALVSGYGFAPLPDYNLEMDLRIIARVPATE